MTAQTSPHDGSAPQDWKEYTDMAVGEILRRTRVYYNLSLSDVEKHLRIRSVHLSALEEGNHGNLPGRAYAIGFVRTYAEYLGLDGEKIVHLFKKQCGAPRAKTEVNIPVPASESKSPNVYIIGVSLVAILAIWGALVLFNGGEEQDVTASNIPSMERILFTARHPLLVDRGPLEEAVVRSVSAMIDERGASAFVIPQSRIVIEALDSSWVEVRDAEGKSLISRILKKGDRYMVPDEAGLRMDTGNVGALAFEIDGRQALPLGQIGDVRRNIQLVPDTFLLAPQNIEPAANSTL